MRPAKELLNNLAGRWNLSGQMGETPLQHSVVARWTLGGMYNELYCQSNLPSQEGLEAAIQVQEGNFFTDDLGRDYDIALLFNISHGLTPEQNIALLQKVAKALNPGGFAVILEQFDTNLPLPMSRAVNNILGLSYYHLLGGQVYTYEQVESWLRTAGYGDIQRINLRKVPGNSLVIGVSKVK